MILRRYGAHLHSVTPDFDPRALTEITFRRDRNTSFPVEDFGRDYEKVEEVELTARTRGNVQSEAEQEVLDQLEARIQEAISALEEGEVLVLENEQGVDFPRLRDRKEDEVVEGENRLRFHWRVDPPLRLGRYRPVKR